jgi:predicted transcriptional regulator
MEVRFKPDLQSKLEKLATETGRSTGELVEDVVAGYFDELAKTRDMLNSRYDDLKSGRVKPTPGDEVIARLREKSATRRRMVFEPRSIVDHGIAESMAECKAGRAKGPFSTHKNFVASLHRESNKLYPTRTKHGVDEI